MIIQAWLKFSICVAIIVVAGVRLTRYGDAIADKTGLGGTWIGLALLATVTSLPELATGLSAVTAAGVPDIAVGDVLGSCVYNLLILAIIDLFKRGEPVFAVASRVHILSAGFSIVLIGLAGLGLVIQLVGMSVSLGHIAWVTPLIVLMYLVAMRTMFRYEKAHVAQFTEQESDQFPQLGLRQVVLRYVVAAALVVTAGIWLPFVAADLARLMHWNQSFVGTLFAAAATSVPELVVTLAAVRLGALDMAIGGIFGSNLFDILILALDDLFFLQGPLFTAVSPIHLMSATTAATMTGGVIVGLYFHPKVRVLRIAGWTSLLLLALYALNSGVLYRHEHGEIADTVEETSKLVPGTP